MRRYIGNITVDKPMQVEKNPEREALRQVMIRENSHQRVTIEATRIFKEMVGENDYTDAVVYLHDDEGRTPANVHPKYVEAQMANLHKQKLWLKAIIIELDRKLKQLDNDRYKKDREDALQADAIEQQEKEKTISEATKNTTQKLSESTRLLLRDALEYIHRSKKLRRLVSHRDSSKLNILGAREIERALRHLFVEYDVDHKYDIPTDIPTRYKNIKDEHDLLLVMEAETNNTIYRMSEVAESNKEYLKKYK